MLSTENLTLELDDNDDLIIPPRFLTGLEGVAQIVRTRMRRIRGEWFRDRLAGMPMLENDVVAERAALLGQKPFNRSKWANAVREAVLSADVPDWPVTEFISLNIAPPDSNRLVVVVFEARVVFDDLTGTISGTETL